MAYRIEFLPSAKRELTRLPKSIQVRVSQRIDALADVPRPPGVSTLKGPEKLLRIRAGDYRIVYDVQDDVLVVLVVRVGHRREMYRR